MTLHWYQIERILLLFVTKKTISQAAITQSGEHKGSQSANVVGTYAPTLSKKLGDRNSILLSVNNQYLESVAHSHSSFHFSDIVYASVPFQSWQYPCVVSSIGLETLITFDTSLLFMIVKPQNVHQKLGLIQASSSALVTCISLLVVPVACEAHKVTTMPVISTSTQGFGVTTILFIAASTALACTIVGKSASICAAIAANVAALDVA